MHGEQSQTPLARAVPVLRAEDWDCSICQLLLLEPVALTCGHAFCRACLERTLRYDDKCALCREPLLIAPDAMLGGAGRAPADLGDGASGWPRAEGDAHGAGRHGLRVCLPLAELLRAAFPAESAARVAEASRLALEADSALPRAVVLDLFVLDATLPRQRLFVNVYEPRYLRMCHRLLARRARPVEERVFGMVGYAPGRSPPCAQYGVTMSLCEAQRTFDGRLLVRALALRRFRVCRAWQEAAESSGRHAGAPGIVRAVVELLDDEQPQLADGSAARAVALAVEVAELCRAWLGLVRAGGWEHPVGQLSALLSAQEHDGGIGPMPEPPAVDARAAPDPSTLLARAQWAAELSWWAAALVNPLPPLGVAPEIRPHALAAISAEERLACVLGALDESAAFLRTPPPALALARAAEGALMRPVGALARAAGALARRWLGVERRSWLARQSRRCVGAVGVVAALAGATSGAGALTAWLRAAFAAALGGVGALGGALRIA
ncbi:hypothetical protein KFE25_003782 [Diacronema lutheri]|uniref:RING-type domain-containing protein n=2 Tax=Diacronema lutheri TaxID=2081491 RepID=A0A8J6C799_DIALT|nr:hypothetical protein KFE25_003782 [Diacronema lutheri]